MCSDEELPEEGNRIKLNKLLKDSVFDQNFKRTSLYLKKGADAALRVNIDAGNLLHHTKNPRIAALLISKGARIDARNRFRLTPLFLAVKEGNYKLVKVLLKHGADVHCFDKKDQNTPLNIAVLAGHLKLVKLLLEYGSAVNDQTNSFSNTPIHLALRLRNINVKIINLLLENRADVNILNFYNESSVHLAVKNSHCPLHITKKIISRSTFINSKDSRNCTPLQYALDRDDYEVVKLLLKHGAEIMSYNFIGFNMLHYYLGSRHAKLKIVKCLLKHNCTFGASEICYANTLTLHGISPLMIALCNLSQNNFVIIKELLHYNANPLLTFTVARSETTTFENTLFRTEQSLTDIELIEAGQSVKTFRENNEISIQVLKWMIKYSAMKSKDNVSFMQSKLKDKPHFYDFLDECLSELPLIEKELGIPLKELFKPSNLKNILPYHIVNKIIQILTTDCFPIYKEVVTALLKKSDLLNRLKYEILCINTENRQRYFLNWTVTCHLVKYLCTQDLLNLFVAIYVP